MRRQPRATDTAKRAIDITVGAVLLICAAPITVVAAIGSAITFRASPIFVQDRVGLGQRSFQMVKIRTLPKDTPEDVGKYDLDWRLVPTFARWLRRLHLDELPQLFLVLLGRMSLVGPRPEMRRLHDALPRQSARARTSVRPGCTGLWQISPASSGLIGESLDYDHFYIEHRSVRLDLWILAQTIRVMISGRKWITLDAIPSWIVDTPVPAERAVVSECTRTCGDMIAAESANAS